MPCSSSGAGRWVREEKFSPSWETSDARSCTPYPTYSSGAHRQAQTKGGPKKKGDRGARKEEPTTETSPPEDSCHGLHTTTAILLLLALLPSGRPRPLAWYLGDSGDPGSQAPPRVSSAAQMVAKDWAAPRAGCSSTPRGTPELPALEQGCLSQRLGSELLSVHGVRCSRLLIHPCPWCPPAGGSVTHRTAVECFV